MGHVEKPNFLISLGITEILGFSELSVYTEVVLLKTYLQHFELCLFANIEKVMKFYNLGDKTFERQTKVHQPYHKALRPASLPLMIID